MNQYSLSQNALNQISATVGDFTALETASLSRECSKLALQNMANSNFEFAHFYLALAKELMTIAVRRKKDEPTKTYDLISLMAS